MRLKRGRKKQKQAWYQSMDNDRSCISKPTPRKSNMPTHTLIVRIDHEVSRFFIPITCSLSLSFLLYSSRSSVPGYFYGVVRSSDFRHPARPTARITIYRIYIYIHTNMVHL